jgi:hypothetical protein
VGVNEYLDFHWGLLGVQRFKVTGSIVDHHAQLNHSSVKGRFRVETSSRAFSLFIFWFNFGTFFLIKYFVFLIANDVHYKYRRQTINQSRNMHFYIHHDKLHLTEHSQWNFLIIFIVKNTKILNSSVNGRFRVETSSRALVSTCCDIQSEHL